MIGGFALVAYPVVYRKTSVITFLVNHEGTLFEKDLGPRTADIAEHMTSLIGLVTALSRIAWRSSRLLSGLESGADGEPRTNRYRLLRPMLSACESGAVCR